ncbi:MAG: hypothetical protein NZ937_05560 [Armatimonadetes bacterium]|nr:hypothetical protein [Armatimonadota bacterium]
MVQGIERTFHIVSEVKQVHQFRFQDSSCVDICDFVTALNSHTTTLLDHLLLPLIAFAVAKTLWL